MKFHSYYFEYSNQYYINNTPISEVINFSFCLEINFLILVDKYIFNYRNFFLGMPMQSKGETTRLLESNNTESAPQEQRCIKSISISIFKPFLNHF